MKSKVLLLVVMILLTSVTSAQDLQILGEVEFSGPLEHDKQISAIAVFDDGKYLIVGVDEGIDVYILKRDGDDRYRVDRSVPLVDFDTKKEIDVEGIAVDGKTVYVIGSHSRKRSTVKPNKLSQKENRERLTENELEPLRESIFRFRLDADGKLDSKIKSASLRKRIDSDAMLKTFAQIPSKENGVDIEGIAVRDDRLYAAFRGPVLRDGYVPVLVFAFAEPDDAKKRYVNLGGRGIRDIVRVNDGFLLIGGPVADEPVSFELYFWDGSDGVPGNDVPDLKSPESLGRIPLPDKDAKAEGITLLQEDDSHYEVMIVYDGVHSGAATRFKLSK